MHPDQRLRKSVKGFYAWIGSLVAAGAGPIIAGRLMESPETTWRIAGVAVGTGSWMPLMMFTIGLIRATDEFTRRIHLVAISMAFAGGLIVLSLVDWLVRAELIEPVPYSLIWLAMLLLWVIALVVIKRRIERGA